MPRRIVSRRGAAGEGGGWQAPWRLLHGLAAIGSPALRSAAVQAVKDAGRALTRQQSSVTPDWLGLCPDGSVTGGIWAMRDDYRTRFAVLAFFRLVTNPRIYSPPATAAEAWQRIEDWLSRPAAWIPVPGARHQQVLGGIVRECRPAGNLVPDAHLAALALEHGLTVVSTDTDFARFPRVAWLNPVSATASWRPRRKPAG